MQIVSQQLEDVKPRFTNNTAFDLNSDLKISDNTKCQSGVDVVLADKAPKKPQLLGSLSVVGADFMDPIRTSCNDKAERHGTKQKVW